MGVFKKVAVSQRDLPAIASQAMWKKFPFGGSLPGYHNVFAMGYVTGRRDCLSLSVLNTDLMLMLISGATLTDRKTFSETVVRITQSPCPVK